MGLRNSLSIVNSIITQQKGVHGDAACQDARLRCKGEMIPREKGGEERRDEVLMELFLVDV